ncbi:RRQRL motif-containing zinc-binding protein [Nocardia gipuzkoensis]
MTAVHDDPQQPDTFAWRAAPAHLRTRRQLRAAGLRPNGQDPAALMVREPAGRKRRRLWAYLFDVRLAAPKRTATPAQLAAVEKAVREHQSRAAERRGISREELTQSADPGPGWNTDPTTHQKGNLMSDTINASQAAEQPQLGVAAGHGQRIAHLQAVVAVNQARHRRGRLDADIDDADRQGEEAQDALADRVDAEIRAVEDRLAAEIPWQNPHAVVGVLSEALLWWPASELAAQRVEQIASFLATEWGVLIDPERWSVSIDPAFDAVRRQDYAEAVAVRGREAAVLDVVSAAPLPEHTKGATCAAIRAWCGEVVDPADPRAHLDDQDQRLEHLREDLAQVKLSDDDRSRVEFTLDYLRGDTGHLDLLDTPMLVDPGEEARGRVPRLLKGFAHHQIAPTEVAEEISVMPDADQQAVRNVGKVIAAGQQADYQVWPGYVDRELLREELVMYAMDAEELRAEADYIVDNDISDQAPERFGVSDDIGERITRMATRREHLRDAAAGGKGLTSMERHQISAVLDDIDTGRIRNHKQLPELMWVDERTKAEVDQMRSFRPASQLSAATKKAVRELIEHSGAVDLSRYNRDTELLKFSVSSIGDTLFSVAGGAVLGVEQERQRFVEQRTDLGKNLTHAGVDQTTKTAVRELIDSQAGEAGQLGRVAAERRTRWSSRVDQIIARRDDAAAQRRAAAAGRSPRSGRCANRPDRAAQTASPTPARSAGRRPVRTAGVER